VAASNNDRPNFLLAAFNMEELVFNSPQI